MRGKSWLKYLIYAVLIAAMVMLSAFIEDNFKRGLISDWRYLIACMVICIAIGLLLGGEYLFREIKKEGKWKLNLPKIIILGLPALYFSLADMIHIPIHLLEAVYNSPFGVIFDPWMAIGLNRSYAEYITLIQVILGYVIITSFYKGSKRILTHYR